MGLTDAGRLYLEPVRTAFGLLDHAERDVQGKNGALAGRVRLSVPTRPTMPTTGRRPCWRALRSSTHWCRWN
jgi:DNA-binding transcriptional LysR family regulator